ncbi:MAG TPA: hypothetical protein VGJ16_07750 [Pirellulales bacterium]
MSTNHKPLPDEVEHLLRNAQLRDELEPYFDESIRSVNVEELPTPVENEFLASMLAWERAPILPISQWFEPELTLPHPDTLDEFQLHERLWETIDRMFGRRIVLEFTDHLTDRDLYCLIYRDILPCSEKKIDSATNYLHWDCADLGGDPTTWLRYYATPEERRSWAEDLDEPLPQREVPPYRRQLPRRPL